MAPLTTLTASLSRVTRSGHSDDAGARAPSASRLRWVVIASCGVLQAAALGSGTLLAQRPAPAPPRAVAIPAGGVFNFTPTTRELIFDGFPVQTTLFRDGERYMKINVPAGWKVAGSSSEMHFENPSLPGARITMRLSSLSAPEKFDDAWVDSVKPLLVSSIPKDSKNGRIVNVVPNVLNVAGWKSIELKIAYDQFSQSMVNDWMFLKLADGRFLEVIGSGKDANFAAIKSATTYILAGWGMVPLDTVNQPR
jgi:hypothetical protein